MKIQTNMTQKEVAVKTVKILHDFFTSNKMDITVGFDIKGNLDYWFNVHGTGDCIVEIYNTSSHSIGDMEIELEKEELVESEIEEMAECFMPGCWGMNTSGEWYENETGEVHDIEIEFLQ